MTQLLTLILLLAAISGCKEKKEEKQYTRTLVVIQGSDTTRTELPPNKYSIYLPEGQYDFAKKDTIRIVYTQFNDCIRIVYSDTTINVSKIVYDTSPPLLVIGGDTSYPYRNRDTSIITREDIRGMLRDYYQAGWYECQDEAINLYNEEHFTMKDVQKTRYAHFDKINKKLGFSK
jgi:hypothetical protein